MSSTIKIRTQLLGQAAMLATLAIFIFAVAGCGDSSNPAASESLSKAQDTKSAQSGLKPEPAKPVMKPVIETPAAPVATPVSRKNVSFEEAEAAYKAGNYNESVDLFTVYVGEHETNPWGHYMLGLAALKAGDTEAALVAFNTSLVLDSTHVKSWLNKSRALLNEHRQEEALFAVEQAMALDPQSSVAYRLKGRSLHAMARLDDAADAYRDALRIDDKDVWAMNNLALILIEQEYFDLAIPSLARATQIRDDIAFIYNNLGMALERTYRFRAAEDAYENAVAIDASHSGAVANLARIKDVEQDPGIEAVDLDRLAINFIDEIQSWGDEVIDRELPLTAKGDLPANEF